MLQTTLARLLGRYMAKHYGTYTALDENGNHISIDQVPPLAERRSLHLKFSCELCHTELVARTGAIRAHYFAHKNACSCDSWAQPMSEWHRCWQEMFPKETREAVLIEEAEAHRADVFLPGVSKHLPTVIEFQHSPISVTEFGKRNAFYTRDGRSIFWVFDWREREELASVRRAGGASIPFDEVKEGIVYTVSFERRLPGWTRAFEEHDHIRKGAQRVHVLVQFSGDSGRGWLFDVSEFGGYSIRGSFIDAARWQEMVVGDWHDYAKAIFDMTEIGAGTETISGALGDIVSFPEAGEGNSLLYWERNGRRREDHSIVLTAMPITFTLRLAPEPKRSKTPAKERVKAKRQDERSAPPSGATSPVHKWSDFTPGVPAPVIEDVPHDHNWDEKTADEYKYTPGDIFETCKGYSIYLPSSSRTDALFHMPLDEVPGDGSLMPRSFLLGNISYDANAVDFPCRAIGRLSWSGGKAKQVMVVLSNGTADEETLRGMHEKLPDMSILYVDLSRYGGQVLSSKDLIDLAYFALGRDNQGTPIAADSARQWLFNSRERARMLEEGNYRFEAGSLFEE